MDDIAVGKAAKDVRDCVDFTNMPEELVTEAFPAGRTADEPGNVDEFELGRDDLCGFCEACGNLQPLVRYRDTADIGLDRAERIVRRLCCGRRGQSIE